MHTSERSSSPAADTATAATTSLAPLLLLLELAATAAASEDPPSVVPARVDYLVVLSATTPLLAVPAAMLPLIPMVFHRRGSPVWRWSTSLRSCNRSEFQNTAQLLCRIYSLVFAIDAPPPNFESYSPTK